jgi:ribosome biogenesis GTPase A
MDGVSQQPLLPTNASEATSGEAVARAAVMAHKSSAGAAGGLRDALHSIIETEGSHELVALVGTTLTLRWDNYSRMKAAIVPTEPCMVVSFLGDTAVGKSTTIAELMGSHEARPFVQRGRDQTASTTFNVNCFPSRSLMEGFTINFLDFEGER